MHDESPVVNLNHSLQGISHVHIMLSLCVRIGGIVDEFLG